MGILDSITDALPDVDILGGAESLYNGAAGLVDDGLSAAQGAGEYLYNGAVELGQGAYGLGQRAVQGVADTADTIYHGLTDWHFEGRERRNGAPPTQAELDDPANNWELLPPWMSVYHDDGQGAPEKKYINPNGKESVRDGDTGAEVTDPRYKATYNYVNPMSWGNVHGVGDAAEFAGRSVGHFAADILPYWIGGNVRGPG